MTMVLYDLGDTADRPISPYSWRIRESLHLLAIPFEGRLLSLTGIRKQFTGANRTVPILIDGDREIGESWQIAEYLSQHRDPEGQLFGGAGGKLLAAFVTDWVDATVMGQVYRMIVKDVHDALHPEDRDFFRAGQEKKLGATLEDLEAARELVRPTFQTSLYPARRAIKSRPYITGDHPGFGDFALHSTFQWSRKVSRFQLLRPDDRLNEWIQRMDDWLAGG